jgi:hypothetical protein
MRVSTDAPFPMAIACHRGRRQLGAVLLAVLVFLFLLTVIVTIFLGEVEDKVRYRVQTTGDPELRRIAQDYLAHTLGVLEEFSQFDSGFHHPAQGWGSPLAYAPFPVDYPGLEAWVSVEDHSHQLALSLLEEQEFQLLLESMGINVQDAMRLRDSYFDWIDADDDRRPMGAEAQDYRIDRRLQLLPANAPLRSVEEFAFITGFADWMDPGSRLYNPERMRVLQSAVTTLHQAPVNLNTAAPWVLRFLEEAYRMDTRALNQYFSGRDRVAGTGDDRWLADLNQLPATLQHALGDLPDRLVGVRAHQLRIRIELVRYGSTRFVLESLVQTASDAATTPSETIEETAPEGNQRNASESHGSMKVLVIQENFLEFEPGASRN